MNERIPTVESGEAITAEKWNRLARKLNEEPAPQLKGTGAAVKGEFWVKNTSNTFMPAFSPVYLTGLASTFSNEDAAKSAIASDRVVLNASLSGSDSTAIYAQLLEPIAPDCVGRATLLYGAAIFSTIYNNGAGLNDEQRAAARLHSFRMASDGDFKILFFDATSRFALMVYSPIPTTYTAGGGIYIDSSNVISNAAAFVWGVKSGSGYSQHARNMVGGAPHVKFGSQFQATSASDSVGDFEVTLKTTGVQVVTAVDFENKTVTTATVHKIG